MFTWKCLDENLELIQITMNLVLSKRALSSMVCGTLFGVGNGLYILWSAFFLLENFTITFKVQFYWKYKLMLSNHCMFALKILQMI